MTKFRIGRHISAGFNLSTTPAYAKKMGYNIYQIFLGAPQQVISKARKKEDLVKLGEELKKYSMKLVIHGSYTINLAHPPGSKLFKTSVRAIVQDLNATALIGKRSFGPVIHMGKNIKANNISDEQAMKNFVYGLKLALKESPSNTKIILETGASQGTEIGSRLEKLAEIYWALDKQERERITFCIDSCHIFASNYNVSTPAGVKEFFKEFDKLIGINKISLIQFNDSKTPLGSHVDRHEDLGYGYIKEPGLKAIAQFAEKHKIPLICETPIESIDPKTNREITLEDEFDKIKSWLKK